MSKKAVIGNELGDGKSLAIDIPRLIETRMLVQANSGGGKSYFIRKLLEETHGHVQQIVLDVEGEFATLREKFDYVLAGKGHDIAADVKTAELLARKTLELEASLIVDLYELQHRDRIRFVKIFLETLTNSPKELWHDVLIVIDEAHLFAPEKGESEAMSAVVDLATRGRKRGFAAVLATQRLSKLHKDVAAECLNKFIGRTSLDIDRKRAADELGFLSQKDSLELRKLKPGQFYAFGPAVSDEVKLIEVGQVKSKHPTRGQRQRTHSPMPTGKIKQILGKLTDLPKAAAEEIEEKSQLRAQAQEFKTRIRDLERELKHRPDPEVPEAKVERLIKQIGASLAKQWMPHLISSNRQIKKLKDVIEGLTEIQLPDTEVLEAMAKMPADVPQTKNVPQKHYGTIVGTKFLDSNGKVESETGRKFHKADRAMLNLFLAAAPKPLTKAQVAGWTGYSINSSTFSNALSNLRAAGLIHGSADHLALAAGREEEAIQILGSEYDPDQTPSIDQWEQKLGKASRELFRVLRAREGQVVTKAELSDLTGYSMDSSTFSNGLSDLCSKKLAKREHGGLKLNEELL